MTIKPILKLASAVVLMGALGTANAASISILPASNDAVAVGDTVSLDIMADFTDVGTIGGGFDVIFDSNSLAFLDATFNLPGDPAFSREGVVSDGLIEGIAFGEFNGLGGVGTPPGAWASGIVGTMTFEVLALGSVVTGAETMSVAGPFLQITSPFAPIDVDYVGATVGSAVIPVPAAAWLMFGGLGALFGFGRKRV